VIHHVSPGPEQLTYDLKLGRVDQAPGHQGLAEVQEQQQGAYPDEQERRADDPEPEVA
jgi:hypothetical protein